MGKKSAESRFTPSQKPLLTILSGPSGVGKDAILTKMKKSGYPLKYITTVTTRPQRAREKNNVDYHFISTERFREMIESNELLEWAKVYGHWYGVPRRAIKQALEEGQDIIVKVDIQGAATIKKILPQAVYIFVVPPSIEELVARLEQRHSESSSNLTLRTKAAEDEIEQLCLFDYVVVNRRDEIDLAVAQVEAIITAEKCRVIPREITL
ncbi:MAG: guanylate kinase [Promethearchaeota archaeon]